VGVQRPALEDVWEPDVPAQREPGVSVEPSG
jgi:hypothetical protein